MRKKKKNGDYVLGHTNLSRSPQVGLEGGGWGGGMWVGEGLEIVALSGFKNKRPLTQMHVWIFNK